MQFQEFTIILLMDTSPYMAIINGQDTNSQEGRANLRNSGYFIDNTGVYNPGSGQRAGDTFSGGQSNQNQTPNNVFLPIQNGTPQSPSNARTYDTRTPGTSYVGDSNFASLFGPGSYFFQSGGPSNFGWMGNGGSAANPADFMSALAAYAQMTAATPRPQQQQQQVYPNTPGAAPNYGATNMPATSPVEPGAAQYFQNNPFTAAVQRIYGH